MLSKRDEERLKRAIRESPKNKRQRELQQRMQEIQAAAESLRMLERVRFREWASLDQLMDYLLDLRDRETPKTADEDWTEGFCMAIRDIPECRAFAEEAWWEYVEGKGVSERV